MKQEKQVDNLSITQKTMVLGTTLGLYQVVKYVVFVCSLSKPTLSIVFTAMALGVPFFAYYIQKRFRDKYSPKVFPFFLSWMVSFLTMFYSVVFSMVISFALIELFDKDGTIFTLLSNQMVIAADTYRSLDGIEPELIEQMERFAKVFSSMTPLSFIKMLIPTVFSSGNIISLIVAALTTKSIRNSLKNR